MNKDAINQRIQALESELAGLKLELNKPNKFEFKYKDNMWFVGKGYIKNVLNKIHKYIDCSSFSYRQTELNAKTDLQLQKELMCIGAVAEQIDPDYKYAAESARKNCICFTDTYIITIDETTNDFIPLKNEIANQRILGVINLRKDIAEKVCEILNNKGVNL